MPGRSGYRALMPTNAPGGVHAGRRSVYWRAHEALRQLVTQKLLIDWSPQQISGWLKMAYPDDETMRVSHETIYRSLFVQARGALKKELTAHLRRRHSLRRSREASTSTVDTRPDSTMRCLFASDPPRSRIAPCQVIGKETCCAVIHNRRSQRWSSASRAS